ncbi:hypothetical protein M426DRAFT_42733, partial [Hypoxylon sp. CI-4A]
PKEICVNHRAKMPAQYMFLPKGDVYMTRNCRIHTHAKGRRVFVVEDDKKQQIGIRVPSSVYCTVRNNAIRTKQVRAKAVNVRDDKMKMEFQATIREQFPAIPVGLLPAIVDRAMEKHSGRVGRTGTIESSQKAKLAVHAYIRYQLTNYDDLLEVGWSKENAREVITGRVHKIARDWRKG